MNESMVVELVKQGGFAVLCAAMFYLYRHDSKAWASKQAETAQAFMAFGERTATALTQVSEGLRRQSVVLERIEQHLNANHLCPVTQVSTDLLREAADAPGGGRRKVDTILRRAIKDLMDQAEHAASAAEER